MVRSKKRLAVLLSIFLVAFSLLSLYLVFFELVPASGLRENPSNMRNWVDESKVLRGLFYDCNGEPIVTRSQAEDGTTVRRIQQPELYSSIIGYHSNVYGKSGLEAGANKYLLNLSSDNIIAKLRDQILEADTGSDIWLSIDSGLQQLAYNCLEGHKGAIVAMEPSTGRILAMVNLPTFDANRIDEDWNDLIADESSPLLNRATQGLYAPGSVMKPITGLALLESGRNLDFNDEGTLTVDGFTFANVGEAAYGEIDLGGALVVSSNTYFASKALEIGAEALAENAKRFFVDFPFDLPMESARIPYRAGMQKTALAAAAFGQGDTLVSPLSMCMAYGAIANGGHLFAPTLLDKVVSASGKTTSMPVAKDLGQIGPANQVETLRTLLARVAVETDSAANIEGYAVAGKTGTAENASGNEHAWYCGYAPADHPQIVVAVVLEEEGRYGGEAAAPIAGRLFQYWMNR